MGILRTDTISGLEAPTPVTGSVLFDGTGDYLQTTTNVSDFQFGSGDFTIESWVYKSTNGSNNYDGLCAYGDSGTQGWFLEISDARGIVWWSGSGIILQYDIDVSKNTWHHISVTRSNGTNRLFLNGIIVAENTTAVSVPTTGTNFYVGYYSTSGNYYFNGYISNLRILKGTALYTSDFTPPVHELQPIGDTVLHCSNNPDSAGAEATGKEITVNGDAAASTFSPGLTRDFTFGTQFEGVAKFDTQGYFVPPSGTTTDRNRTGGRAVIAGGYPAPVYSNVIEYVSITSTGNSQDFGDLTIGALSMAPTSSSTRGVWMGKEVAASPFASATIDYVTIASTGDALDFGDLDSGTAIRTAGGVSSSTRGIMGGGVGGLNKIQFITFASLGNATDFSAVLTDGRRDVVGAQSTTRGLFAGGIDPAVVNVIDFVTMATTGTCTDFGDLVTGRTALGAVSSHTRAVFGSGGTPNSTTASNIMDYVTIATTGNTQDFGDAFVTRAYATGTSNAVRGIFAGGDITPSPQTYSNTIDYITIASTGDATDFGDSTQAARSKAAVSDSHGGLS